LKAAQARQSINPAGREPTLSIGGLLQGQADFGDKGDARFTSANDRFYLRRARINIQGKFLEEFDSDSKANSPAPSPKQRAIAHNSQTPISTGIVSISPMSASASSRPRSATKQLAADPKLFSIERTLANDRLTVGRQIGVQIGGDLLNKAIFLR